MTEASVVAVWFTTVANTAVTAAIVSVMEAERAKVANREQVAQPCFTEQGCKL